MIAVIDYIMPLWYHRCACAKYQEGNIRNCTHASQNLFMSSLVFTVAIMIFKMVRSFWFCWYFKKGPAKSTSGRRHSFGELRASICDQIREFVGWRAHTNTNTTSSIPSTKQLTWVQKLYWSSSHSPCQLGRQHEQFFKSSLHQRFTILLTGKIYRFPSDISAQRVHIMHKSKWRCVCAQVIYFYCRSGFILAF